LFFINNKTSNKTAVSYIYLMWSLAVLILMAENQSKSPKASRFDTKKSQT